MEEVAYAKINLALHVRAREADGYHRLETLFAFARDGDVLHVGPGEGLSLTITGPFGQGLETNDNLVLRAARALQEATGHEGTGALLLDKRLPVASGIGGGSADAAAALRLLNRWWGIGANDEELVEIARTLGADVPACVASVTARGEGRGDVLTPVQSEELAGRPLLLVNPLIPVPTGAVFAGWDGVDRGALGDPLAGRNDLEAPALAIAPVIAQVLDALASRRPPLRRMSGSGATCFALFDTIEERDAASEAIGSAHPGWWRLASALR